MSFMWYQRQSSADVIYLAVIICLCHADNGVFSPLFFLQHNERESYPAMVFILCITILELSVKTMNLYNRFLHQLFPVASHWHTLLYNAVSSTPRMKGTKKSENVINTLWQLCHMLRTSKRHWNVIKCFKVATIFRSLPIVQNVGKNRCFTRKWFCAWKYYKNHLHVRVSINSRTKRKEYYFPMYISISIGFF
jgi:hypothetical protein